MKTIKLVFYIFFISSALVSAQDINPSEIMETNSINPSLLNQLNNYNTNIGSIGVNNALQLEGSSIYINTRSRRDQQLLRISIATNHNTTHHIHNTSINTTDGFLIWGNNGSSSNTTASEVTVNLSANLNSTITTATSYSAMQRIWKIIEIRENTPTVNLKIPETAFANTTATGNYYMLISDSEVFDSNVDYRILTSDGNGNLESNYSFDGTSYVSFGFSPQISEERSIYFEGTNSYIDVQNKIDLNPNGFTISAWINNETTNPLSTSILSKRDVEFTEGYDLTLTPNNKIEIQWKNQNIESLVSHTSIPNNEWHHIAVSYNGSEVSIYIDGVLDHSAYRTNPMTNNASFLIGAAGKTAPIQHFKGSIDEVRIWNEFLTEDQIRFIMNQEISNNSGQVIGKALPLTITKNDINTIPWSALVAYYPMSHFSYKTVVDATGNGHNGLLKHLLTVDEETAPLPYISAQDGDWNQQSSWKNGAVQYAPGSASIVDSNITIDWSIVRTAHQLSMDNSTLPITKQNNRTLLSLFVEANQLILPGDTALNEGNGLTITHHLSLTGKIDLEGESQLIQTLDSDLDVISNGEIQCDQQGTSDTYTYNYWSSPVTKTNSSTEGFKIYDVMLDGTNASNPLPINFSSSGYNGAPTLPIKIADYWIWKYSNNPSNTYSAWQHIRRTGTILPGEGFTMKGPGTGLISTPQNYVFNGKPNNGDISLPLSSNNDYLVGNPYPSAIDADQFIRDNGLELYDNTSTYSNDDPLISGTLYFWNHWGGGSHTTHEYQGGYATYNLSGGIAAAFKKNNYPEFTDGSPTKRPSRSIAVGQGFFVIGKTSGGINFNNGQRIFKKEGNSAMFVRSPNADASEDSYEDEDDRMKFRIGFNSVNTISRQLLLTIDENATPDVDWAYDGILYEQQIDDMFWLINDESYIIQASNTAEASTTFPIGIKTNTDGINSITIDALEHVPSNMTVYVHDMSLNLYHDLSTGDYDVFLNAGEYLDRFEITFSNHQEELGINDHLIQNVNVIYSNDIDKIVIVNPKFIELKSMTLFNLLGQSVYTNTSFPQSDYSEYNIENLSAGTYIIKLQTVTGAVAPRKIIVE
ncbi:LamG-like jellyroll fold domain-containing protein [Winogradskyella ludwigii]|uniref:LamG-like jellyroll fold domain-containing protein n=1 Tax=Winogradskyella ludwigii TaxID=2686076 RepID=UPI0015CABC23|nr:LamG-like jellyroll fold domain-containing protein [Winogradskyella ludwigii]